METGLRVIVGPAGSGKSLQLFERLRKLKSPTRALVVLPSMEQADELTSRLVGRVPLGVSAVSLRSLVSELSGRSADEASGRAIRVAGISYVLSKVSAANELLKHPHDVSVGQLAWLFRELEDAGLNGDEFKRRLHGISSTRSSGNRLRSVAEVYASYRELLEKHCWQTDEMGISSLGQENQPVQNTMAGTTLMFDRFIRLTRSQEMLIGTLSKSSSVFLTLMSNDSPVDSELENVPDHAEASAERLAKETGASVIRAEAPSSGRPTAPDIIVGDNIFSECTEVLRRIRLLVVDGVDPTEIALVARNPGLYGQPVALAAKRFDVPLRTRADIALSRFLLVQSFIDKMDTAISGKSAARSQLLNGDGEPDLVSRFADSIVPGMLGENPALLPQVFEEACARARVAKTLLASLPYSAGELNATTVLRDLLRSYASVFSALDEGGTSLDSLWAGARQLILGTRVGVTGDQVGVYAFTSPEQLLTGEFRHVFAVGFCEGVFPAPYNPGALLKNSTRERFNKGENLLGTEGQATGHEYKLLDIIRRRSGAQLTISLPVQDLNGRPLLPSRYLEELGYTQHLSDTSHLVNSAKTYIPDPASVSCKRDAILIANLTLGSRGAAMDHDEIMNTSTGHLPVFRARTRPGGLRDQSSLAFLRERSRYSVGEIAGYAHCPLMHFCQHTLRLEPDAPSTYLREGNLLHEALVSLIKQYRRIPQLPVSEVFRLAREELGKAQASRPKDSRVSNATLARLLPLLLRFVVAEARILVQEEREPVGFELSLPGKKDRHFGEPRSNGIAVEHDGAEFPISGRIDRVDKLADGKYAVVDYKLSTIPSVDLDGGKSIQVLLYTASLECSFELTVRLAEYISITGLGRRVALSSDDRSEKIRSAMALAQRAVSSIRDGALALADEDCSERCAFASFCKREWCHELFGQRFVDDSCTGITFSKP